MPGVLCAGYSGYNIGLTTLGNSGGRNRVFRLCPPPGAVYGFSLFGFVPFGFVPFGFVPVTRLRFFEGLLYSVFAAFGAHDGN